MRKISKPIGFTVQANPNDGEKGKAGKTFYHVRQAKGTALTSKELCAKIVNSTTITDSDYDGFIAALKSFIPDVLNDGHDLHIEGLGTFFLKMRIAKKKDKDGKWYTPKFEKAEDITARNVTVTGIGFKPDKELNESVTKVEHTFCNIKEASHSAKVTRSRWLKGLHELIEEQGFFTLRDIIYKFHVTPYMANKMLTELINEEFPKYHRKKVGATWIYKKTGEAI